MTLKEYIDEVNRQFATGLAGEHSYRPALQRLLSDMLPDMVVTNEPSRIKCGAPDYIITRRKDNLPMAFIEAKDIGDSDLDGNRQHKEQFNRYRSSLDCIIFTDYLDFHIYRNGDWVESIRIGELRGNKVYGLEGNFERFAEAVKTHTTSAPQKIISAGKLASLMASKAKMLASTIRGVLEQPVEDYGSQQLSGQFEAFKRVLLHDITIEGFADIYAQTIAYGMFAARLHDTTPEDFSRQEAAALIPKTTPFLRQIFQNIAGYDLDDRVAWIVDDLASTFAATDMPKIIKGYGSDDRHSDPMIHFYEDFLTAYDPGLRKSKGVWYTPSAVVSFIVRSVDEILKRDFGLPMGLADYSKIEHEVVNENYDVKVKGSKRMKKQSFHRVQVLDPSVGTGTFLAETVNRIYDKFAGMQGMWQGYVEEHLLPRINGFELLMAPYAIAHLKMDWLLGATGYNHNTDRRVRIYLTNSLEEYHKDIGTLFSQWLSHEANEASRIKRDTPVMVVVGNPPYSGTSVNNGEWITNLMKSYKREPGGMLPLNERNPKWLNDDYVKFIRMAQYFIEQNGEGVLAFINPHGFLDNPTFRGMRWELLRVFDDIYTLDLHGNSKKKEVAPDGGKDENVFDIMQGVSINFFIKTGVKKKNQLGRVYHADLYGKREWKYSFLNDNDINTVPYVRLEPKEPMYFFVPKDLSLEKEYNAGFGVNELFVINSVGVVTTKDSFLICDTPHQVKERIDDIIGLDESTLRQKYGLKDTRDWSILRAKADVGMKFDEKFVTEIDYRWGDRKFLYYTGLTNGIVARPRFRSLSQLVGIRNMALITVRQIAGKDWQHVSVSDTIVENCRVSTKTKECGYVFPLYVKSDDGLVPNFNSDTVDAIERSLGMAIDPEELFDYIYGVLHSENYRQRFKELLKGDFPRIPYPTSGEDYRRISALGREIRKLHLFERSEGWMVTTTYPVSGDNVVEQAVYREGMVYINESQYFGNVPVEIWDMWIGGYQPAQKWLKDRRGRVLGFGDIRHYHEMLYSLMNTRRLMTEIDKA